MIWLLTANLRVQCPSKKLGPRLIGLFSIQKIINTVTVRLLLSDSSKVHVSYLKPVSPDPFPGMSSTLAPLFLVHSTEEYKIEVILN